MSDRGGSARFRIVTDVNADGTCTSVPGLRNQFTDRHWRTADDRRLVHDAEMPRFRFHAVRICLGSRRARSAKRD